MTKEIYKLFADNKPLPKGTRIKTTIGGAHCYAAEISRIVLARQNIDALDGRNMPSNVILDLGTALDALLRAEKKLRLQHNDQANRSRA